MKTSILGSISNVLAAVAQRTDSWINAATGFGTSRDKTTYGSFLKTVEIGDEQASALFHGDDMARKVVSFLPKEAMRQGWDLKAKDPGTVERIKSKFRALDVKQLLLRGFIWGRAFGGAALFLGVIDGNHVTEPLDEKKVTRFDFLTLYDKRRCVPIEYYDDTTHPRYGWPKRYQLTQLKGGTSIVHESRLIMFGGDLTADQEKLALNFWDYSILQTCYEALQQFNENNKAAELLLTDASTAVFKMKGLLAAIASGGSDLATRAQLVDMTRSVARAVMLDAEAGEDFTKVATVFSGVADMLDRSANRLAAASSIPVNLLIGQAPAGLNATGDNVMRGWYDNVQSYRDDEVCPRLERIVRITQYAQGTYVTDPASVSFPSLWQESPKEKADRMKVDADADQIRINSQVLTPEEVAESRYGDDEYGEDIKQIDMSSRRLVPAPLPAPGVPGKPAAAPVAAPGTPQGASTGALPVSGVPQNVPPFVVGQGPKQTTPGIMANSVGPTSGNPWPIEAEKPKGQE